MRIRDPFGKKKIINSFAQHQETFSSMNGQPSRKKALSLYFYRSSSSNNDISAQAKEFENWTWEKV